jgi:23S rRNA (uracil1939-C5)-methyltransferase
MSNKIKSKTVQFKIQSLDSLGQGVSKENGEIVFIPKTLPGEEGIAKIIATKKKVAFGSLQNLTKVSDSRIDSECPHYSLCGGCHYLHTNYENEINLKKQAMIDIFERQHGIEIQSKLEILNSQERFSYRNRVQLHYDLNTEKLGFRSQETKEILEVPNCLLPDSEVAKEVSKLYKDQSWKKLAKKKKQGHIEIYHRNNKVDIVANERYAFSGFSQVNIPMNELLLSHIEGKFSQIDFKNKYALDIFGGNGNLTAKLEVETLVVDATPEKFINLRNQHQSYQRIDLFKDNSLELLKNHVSKQPDLLMVDPPRSGFKQLDLFTQEFNPQHIIYVSCNPQSLARDLKNLGENYELEKVFMVDFFPGTKHFESMVFLKRI